MIQRRHRDPVFAAAKAKALATGSAALEANLVHSAFAALGENGEADWLEDFGSVEDVGPEVAGPAFPMSADEAMRLLFRHWRLQERLAKGQPPPPAMG